MEVNKMGKQQNVTFKEIKLHKRGIVQMFKVISFSGEDLGKITWYHPWREYCFEPDRATIWSGDVLSMIQFFIQSLMTELTESHGPLEEISSFVG